MTLVHDVTLVRAAILYADEVELAGESGRIIPGLMPGARRIHRDQIRLDESNQFEDPLWELERQQLESMLEIMPPSVREQFIKQHPDLFVHPKVQRQMLEEEANRSVDRLAYSLEENLRNRQVSDYYAHDLILGLERGVLKIPSYWREVEAQEERRHREEARSGFRDASLGPSSRDADAYFKFVGEMLQDPTRHILFDSSSRHLADLLVRSKLYEPNALTMKRSASAAAGTGMIMRLPAFPDARLDELLDLRKDLRVPLLTYQVAANRLGASLNHRTYERESQAELDDIYRYEVAPSLERLQNEFIDHGLVREIARAYGTDRKTLITEGAGVFIAFGGFISLASAATTAFGISLPLAIGALQGGKDFREQRRRLQTSDLYFLYEANRRLRLRNQR